MTRNKGKLVKIASSFLICILVLMCCQNPLSVVKAADIGQARIVVDSFSVSGDGAVPGESFELTLNLKNTSNTYSAYNILVTLSSETGILPVYGASNQIYIDSIAASESTSVTFDVVTASQLEVDYLEEDILISSYDNNTVNQSSNISTIMIPFQLKSTLILSGYTVPDQTKVGTKARVSATYVNSGMEELSNIQMMITGDGLSKEYTASLGNLGAGDSNIAEVYLDFISAGTKNLYMSFQYNDSDGEVHNTVSQNFVVVVDDVDSTGGDYTIVDNTLGSGSVIQLILLAAIVVLGVVVAVMIRMNQKNK